jgi:class 3 adenylate cyclase
MERTVRRLAAILAADVVGYSGKIEADESSTLAALRDVRATTVDPLLAENSGRIIKTMGDGFIAEFGSVVDAVTFAVAMQKSVPERQQGTAPEKRLVYRIGINLGDVVVEGDDLLGDGVNVAARLEQICKPGEILISGTAYDQLQGKLGLPLDFTGEQQVKNINRSVRTYAVQAKPNSRSQLNGSFSTHCGPFRGGVCRAAPAFNRPLSPRYDQSVTRATEPSHVKLEMARPTGSNWALLCHCYVYRF